MGVIMQAFHWDCPREDRQEFAWWNHVRLPLGALAQAGFTALWLPPVHKAANIGGQSMGYDPYDYYDLGEFDQKGSIPTWFGTRDELLALIGAAHDHGMQVIADMVFNHNSGADATEHNPISGDARWTLFEPKSGRFKRNWECFHPSPYETWDDGTFGDMPDLSHRNPYVFGEVLKLAKWLVEEIGFDGFRYDFVKGYGPWMVTAIQEYRYMRGGEPFKPYGVGEHWDSARSIENWTNETNAWNDNPVDAFDFPGRDMLKALCDSFDFSMRRLADWDTLLRSRPESAVTFVENHDTRDGDKPIVNDKLLGYAFILTHEGYPCVFWKDYFNWGLGMADSPNGIAALVRVHEAYAGGTTRVLQVDDDLYIMQRAGHGAQPGLVLVMNNRGDRWNGATVETGRANTAFEPVAWWSGADMSRPHDEWTDAGGRGGFWAPPRGYAVYVPK